MKRSLGVLVVVALVAAACGSSTDSASMSSVPAQPSATSVPFISGDLIRLDLPRSEPNVSDAEIAAVVDGDTAFGLDLLRAVAGEDNVMVSPYSVATALSMLYPGARGQTATEIAEVLHLKVDDATLHDVRSVIDAALADTPQPQGEEDTRSPFTIRPANSAWGQGGYPFLEDYLSVLAAGYGAGLRVVDFMSEPEAATDTINQWVEDATEDRIKDLIPDGTIDVDTRLVLVNAIWFKGNWAQKFDPANTALGQFTLADGSQVSVPMMMNPGLRTGYASTKLFDAVRLPYAGDAAMVVVLPRQGSLADLIAELQPTDLEIEWGDFFVDIALPSFEFEADVDLKGALQELGMKAAFTPPFTGSDAEADLTGITEVRELFVSDALHKTFIALDEYGTEAAAATALIIGRTSLPQSATFTADSPFLFWIEHSTTGELLFLGQVTDPS